MATTEQVRQTQTAQPFRPFVVRLADGRSFKLSKTRSPRSWVRGLRAESELLDIVSMSWEWVQKTSQCTTVDCGLTSG